MIQYKTSANLDIVKKRKSFESESTNPVDLDLPATINNHSAFDLINLMESGVNYLKNQGVEEDDILIMLGSRIAETHWFVGSWFKIEILSKNQPNMLVSKVLDNNIIICDKNAVETINQPNMLVSKVLDNNIMICDKNAVEIISDLIKCSVSIPDPKKSLFYRDVLKND